MLRAKPKKPEPISNRVSGALGRFILAGLFGCGVAWIILVELDCVAYSYPRLEHVWTTAIWLTPVLWGLLGVFWFDNLLECGRRILEAYFGVGDGR